MTLELKPSISGEWVLVVRLDLSLLTQAPSLSVTPLY